MTKRHPASHDHHPYNQILVVVFSSIFPTKRCSIRQKPDKEQQCLYPNKDSRFPVNPGLISYKLEPRVRCHVRHTAKKKRKRKKKNCKKTKLKTVTF